MWPWSLCRVEEFHDASMTPVAPSDNPLFSVRNLLSDRRPNLSSSKWGAVSVVVGGSSNKCFLQVEMVRQPSFWIWEKTMVHLDKMVQPRYLCIFGLLFLKNVWNDWKRLQGIESQGAPARCQWINTRGFRISKYENDGLNCLQKNQPLVYSLATPGFLISFLSKACDLSQLITPWILCVLLCFYLQVYELQLYESFSFLPIPRSTLWNGGICLNGMFLSYLSSQ